MDDDTPSKPDPARPSKAPSWVALGFVLGSLFVLALPRHSAVEPAPGPEATAPSPRPARAQEAPRITTIEAVFEAWGKYAIWSEGTTEVALWNSDTRSFSDCYEVMKLGDAFYFRTIPALTRPILTHGVVTESPLEFTETARQREEWLGEVNRENWKAIGDSERQGPPPPTGVPDERK